MKPDTLYQLQRKYGTGNKAPWKQVAVEDIGLPKIFVKDKSYREQFRDILGLYQPYQSQKAPWFVELDKLAKYLDKTVKRRA